MVARRAHGIDISAWQKIFNPPDEIKEEIDFVILKASQEKSRDRKFESFYSAAMNFPLRGAYHYYTTLNTKSSKLLPKSAIKKSILKNSAKKTVINNGIGEQVEKVRIQTVNGKGAGSIKQMLRILKSGSNMLRK
jgi:hypothetical protein